MATKTVQRDNEPLWEECKAEALAKMGKFSARAMQHADLDIAEGGAASDAWAQLISPATSTAEKAKIASDLRTYCKLDTHAMYQIWHHLHELVKV